MTTQQAYLERMRGERIATLEAELKDAKYALEMACDLGQVGQLEAENARLREALNRVHRAVLGGSHKTMERALSQVCDISREALASSDGEE